MLTRRLSGRASAEIILLKLLGIILMHPILYSHHKMLTTENILDPKFS